MRLWQVGRSFGQIRAVDDVTFDVAPGEIFGLLGHNGAGKTTLIRMINGLLTPDQGIVETLGHDPVREGSLVRRRTGVLTTYPGLDEYLSPAENLIVYAAINGLARPAAGTRTAGLLSRLGLDPASRQPCRGLSAGLKQRVALTRALVHDPELLLLDEPTANLDPLAARDVRGLVRELADQGRTVIFSTHNLAEAEQLCDRVAILRQGRLMAVGSLDQLASGRLQTSTRIRVAPGQGELALEVLRGGLNGHHVSLAGNDITLGGVDGRDIAVLVRRLVLEDIAVHAVLPTSPTLEDIYLAVHDTTRTA